MTFWTYMLHCADRTFYVGHTDDLEKRFGEHQLGHAPGYTRTGRPVKVVWAEAFPTREEARAAEKRLKGWGQPKKLALIRGDWALISLLARGKKQGASTSSAKPVSVFLHPHLNHLPAGPLALEVVVARRGDRLHLRYRLTGELAGLRIPAAAPPCRANELWRHTCFESFIKSPDGQSYVELNLAPSSEWAAYAFDSHRMGMRALEMPSPRITIEHDRFSLELSAAVSLPPQPGMLHLNLTAIIEETSGRKSYWALAHPPGPPDFHHPDCFVLELPPS